MMIFQPDRYLLKKQIKKSADFIRGRILDVGAGGTLRYKRFFEFSEYATLDNKDGHGVDIVASADALPLKDETFDGIVCTQVLEHVPNPDKVLTEFFRVLKKGGCCLVTVPQLNELHEEPHDYWRYTKFGLEDIFKKHGFTIVAINQIGGFFSSLAQMNTRYLIDRFDIMRSWSKFFWGPCTQFYGRFMVWLDSVDKSCANRKHAIGWLVIAKK